MNTEDTIKLIMDAPVDEWVKLNHLVFYAVKFDPDYCWVAKTHYSYGGSLTFPMRTSQKVKIFKTLNGAKRNFLRRAHLIK